MKSEQPSKLDLLVVLGATATGKTNLAVALATELDGEIISADSRQVFKGMNIGTGKDLHEYARIPYHLIDILDAGEEFNLFEFQRLFMKAYSDIKKRSKVPILCGGSAMYLDAVLSGYKMAEVQIDAEFRNILAEKSDDELTNMLRKLKPKQHNSTDLLDRNRTVRAIEIAIGEHNSKTGDCSFPDIDATVIGISRDREEVRNRITARLKYRLENGMIDEVKNLQESGISWEKLDYYGLEYRYIGKYLRNELSWNEMFKQLNSAIHNFAKRQRNWFQKMERNGIKINWIDGGENMFEDAIRIIHDGSPLEI